MANDCCGVLKVVAKDKETLERVYKILTYKDNEYCLYRCRFCKKVDEEPIKSGEYWVQDFDVGGAWNCEHLFTYEDKPNDKLILDYDKNNKPIYGTAHFTGLNHLAEVLHFGCELYACEGGNCFCEYLCVNSFGEFHCENGEYNISYPKNANGECDYEAEPTEEFGIEHYGEYEEPCDIYG